MPSPSPGQQPAPRRAPVEQSYQFGGWSLATTKSHILTSEEAEAVSGQFELPHLPDMLFTNNKGGRASMTMTQLLVFPTRTLLKWFSYKSLS